MSKEKFIFLTTIFFIVFYKVNSQLICNKYNCDTNMFSSNECFKKSDNKESISNYFNQTTNSFYAKNSKTFNVILNYCNGGTKCEKILEEKDFETYSSSIKCITPETVTVTKGSLLDEESCKNNEDCASGNCFNAYLFSYCYFNKDQGINCIDSKDCPKNKFCNTLSKKCEEQKVEGSTCSSQIECRNYNECYNNICIKLYSIPSGQPAIIGKEYFCQSNFIYKDLCQDFILTNKNENTENSECTTTGKCNYILPLKNDNITLSEGFCNCGFNLNGTSYCRHGSDSLVYKDYVSEIEKILGYIKGSDNTLRYLPKCHPLKRLNCNNISQRENQGIKYLLNAYMGKFQNVEGCLSKIISRAINLRSFISIVLFFYIIF